MCSVLSTRCPCEGGLHGNRRSFRVTDFADHDNVGVLAQDRAQRVGERAFGLDVDLDLRRAGEFVFDRILDRDQVVSGSLSSVIAV